MPKFNVTFALQKLDGVAKTRVTVEAATPEEAVALARPDHPGQKLAFVAEAKRGRPPKQSLVEPDPA